MRNKPNPKIFAKEVFSRNIQNKQKEKRKKYIICTSYLQ